jgi:hypothetical protein
LEETAADTIQDTVSTHLLADQFLVTAEATWSQTLGVVARSLAWTNDTGQRVLEGINILGVGIVGIQGARCTEITSSPPTKEKT